MRNDPLESVSKGTTEGTTDRGEPTGRERRIIRTMTTINNYNDFIEALGNNRQWRDTVRAHILSEDLLQLPVNFEAFTEEQKGQNQKGRYFRPRAW